jgi:hypothetical protein
MEELKPTRRPETGNAPDAGRWSGKGLFVFLAVATSLLLCLALVLAWLIPTLGLGGIHPSLPYITGVLAGLLVLTILLGALGFIVHVHTGRPFPGSSLFRSLSIRLFLPTMELLGRLAGISPEKVRRSFITANNDMVGSAEARVEPDRILILLPHCLQRAACDFRLSHDVDNCRRCGLCPMGGLLDLRDRYGVHLAVATGGTIARRIVVEKRPRFIIAVACERDLSSGIQDTYPLPVFGVLNERPNGPCFDTRVSLAMVEAALRRFIPADKLPERSPL